MSIAAERTQKLLTIADCHRPPTRILRHVQHSFGPIDAHNARRGAALLKYWNIAPVPAPTSSTIGVPVRGREPNMGRAIGAITGPQRRHVALAEYSLARDWEGVPVPRALPSI